MLLLLLFPNNAVFLCLEANKGLTFGLLLATTVESTLEFCGALGAGVVVVVSIATILLLTVAVSFFISAPDDDS